MVRGILDSLYTTRDIDELAWAIDSTP